MLNAPGNMMYNGTVFPPLLKDKIRGNAVSILSYHNARGGYLCLYITN